jgi:hypothetical protein
MPAFRKRLSRILPALAVSIFLAPELQGALLDELWSVQTATGGQTTPWIHSSAAIGSDGLVYMGGGDSDFSRSKFYALDPSNAQQRIRWTFPAAAQDYISGSADIHSPLLLAASTRSTPAMLRLNVSNGLWIQIFPSSLRRQSEPTEQSTSAQAFRVPRLGFCMHSTRMPREVRPHRKNGVIPKRARLVRSMGRRPSARMVPFISEPPPASFTPSNPMEPRNGRRSSSPPRGQ